MHGNAISRAAAFPIAALLSQYPCGGALRAQEITLRAPIQLSHELEQHPLIEPHIAAHPTDTRHLLAATMVSTAAEDFGADVRPRIRCSSFLSSDGGATWARHDFSLTECFDPWVTITADGRAVFSALGVHPSSSERQFVVFKSPDGGRTWDDTPVALGIAHDRPTTVADRSAPAREGWIYAISSQNQRTEKGNRRRGVFVARSRDAGRTFDAPKQLLMNNRFHNAEMPVVLSDGTVVVAFTTDSWDAGGDQPRRGWVVRSADGARTFSVPLFVTDACGPPRFALSAFAADLSGGPFRDRLYFACNELGGGAVVVTASADRGETWSEPVPVHSAPPADTAALRHVRALAVNNRGVLGIVWADRWGTRDEPRCYETFFAASLDGGRTFLPAQRLTRERHCIDWTANGANARTWPTGGDYFGLTAAMDGRFHVVWPEAWDGRTLQIWTAVAEVDGKVGADGRAPPQR